MRENDVQAGLSRMMCWLTAVAVAAAVSQPLHAAPVADKAFTVANYPVEADAANAVAAKDKALADGQEAAFRSLLKRIVPVTSYKQLDRLKGLTAAEIVDGVRVRSEQNSATRYIASLDFSYQADAVRDVLRRENIPFVDELAPEIVLVPVLFEAKEGAPAKTATSKDAAAGKETAAGEFRPAAGAWSQVWSGLDLDNTLTPARIAPLRPEIHPDTLRMLMSGAGGVERILAGEYKAERVVVAIAEVDTAGKRVTVTLAGMDAVGPVSWKRSYRIYDGDAAYAQELAAVVSLGVLEGRWKTLKTNGSISAWSQGAGGGEDVDMEVQFADQGEWDSLRGRLLDLPGVDNVRVGAVSPSSARVAVSYPGGGFTLAEALSQQGLTLTQSGTGWVLRAGY